MSEPKWTKGPWIIAANENLRLILEEATQIPIAEVRLTLERYAAEERATANLIAAAPELYEALKQLVYECRNEGWGFLAAADAALAKARGEQ